MAGRRKTHKALRGDHLPVTQAAVYVGYNMFTLKHRNYQSNELKHRVPSSESKLNRDYNA